MWTGIGCEKTIKYNFWHIIGCVKDDVEPDEKHEMVIGINTNDCSGSELH